LVLKTKNKIEKEADQASFDYSYREISLELVYIIVET